jgi:protein TonB
MNIITRFKWPVIIAAGLHGALFVSFSPDRTSRSPVEVEAAKPLDPIPKEIDLRVPEESDPAGDAGGGEDPLPKIPETLAPPAIDNPFEMPVTERSVPDKSVIDLTKHRIDGPTGPGDSMRIGTPDIAGLGNLDRVPRAMARPAPAYPHAMRQDGVTGDVTVEFIVGIDGTVISAQAVRWSRREFVDAAVNAVLRWRFEPGTVNGRRVRFRMAIPIEFYATR